MKKARIVFVFIFFVLIKTFAQEQLEFFDAYKFTTDVFSNISINSDGKLCIKMKDSGNRYLMRIDDNEDTISIYNNTYCIKDSIHLIEKHSKFSLKRNNSNYWIANSDFMLFNKSKRQYGAFKIENNSFFRPINKEEYQLFIQGQ